MAELLPWLNLLLVPMIGATWRLASALLSLKTELVAVATRQDEQQRRLAKLESGLLDLR